MEFFGLGSNPVAKEFEVGKQTGTCGPWKIFAALHRTRKDPASVFTIQKKEYQIDSSKNAGTAEAIEHLKRGPLQLQKLRFPTILHVLCPLAETKDALLFATEPVLCSLANLLTNFEGVKVDAPPSLSLSEVEIHWGLFQVCEAIKFCHGDAQLFHGNVSCDEIVISRDWGFKLAGFSFAFNARTETSPKPPLQSAMSPLLRPILTPSIVSVAPEMIKEDGQHFGSFVDVYSLGIVFCVALCHEDQRSMLLARAHEIPSVRDLRAKMATLRGYLMNAISSVNHDSIRSQIERMIVADGYLRPKIDDVLSSSLFETLPMITLRILATIIEKDVVAKAQFLKSLPRVIPLLPHRVLVHKVLPPLFGECKDKAMIPLALPPVFLIAESFSKDQFAKGIFPSLIPLLGITEPLQVLNLFMQHMDLLLTKTPPELVHRHVLPIIYHGLDSSSPDTHALLLSVIPSFMTTIDYNSMKHQIIPRIQALCLKSTHPPAISQALECLTRLLEVMDKWIFHDSMVPMLERITCREQEVLLAILSVYTQALKLKKFDLTRELLARKVLPFLLPMTVEPTLSATGFALFMETIHEMLSLIQTERMGHLKQLEAMQDTISNKGSSVPVLDEMVGKLEKLSTGPPSVPTLEPFPPVFSSFNPPKQQALPQPTTQPNLKPSEPFLNSQGPPEQGASLWASHIAQANIKVSQSTHQLVIQPNPPIQPSPFSNNHSSGLGVAPKPEFGIPTSVPPLHGGYHLSQPSLQLPNTGPVPNSTFPFAPVSISAPPNPFSSMNTMPPSSFPTPTLNMASADPFFGAHTLPPTLPPFATQTPILAPLTYGMASSNNSNSNSNSSNSNHNNRQNNNLTNTSAANSTKLSAKDIDFLLS